jgi:uncharacterized membrane protein YcaP (DUF421 family)
MAGVIPPGLQVLLLDGSLPVGASLWKMAQPWWEFVLRGLLVYGFLLLVLRLTGKRQVGQLSPFDLVLLMLLSNAVQNSMNAGDNTVVAGYILVLTLVAVNALVSYLTFRSKKLESLIEGKPEILVHNGVIQNAILDGAQISHHELLAAVRRAGIADVSEVHVAILETNGQITVVPKMVQT